MTKGGEGHRDNENNIYFLSYKNRHLKRDKKTFHFSFEKFKR